MECFFGQPFQEARGKEQEAKPSGASIASCFCVSKSLLLAPCGPGAKGGRPILKTFVILALQLANMKKFLFLFIFCMVTSRCFSISDGDSTKIKSPIFRENHYLDVSIGLGEKTTLTSIQWDKFFGIARNRIKIGFGVRMNVANFWNQQYYTAPPQRLNGAFDTLSVAHQAVYFLNLQFVFDVPLLKWWDVGMNIDLVGASWGPKADGAYYSNATGHNGSTQNVSPETLNLMLFGHNDFGNLNSQFYMRFWPADNVFIKAGMGLATFTNQTDAALNNGFNRFGTGSYLGFVSLGWTPGRNEWESIGSKRAKLITPAF